MSLSNYENHLQLLDGIIEALKISNLPYPVECKNCGGSGEVQLTPQQGEWDYTDFRISTPATYGPCPECEGKGYTLVRS